MDINLNILSQLNKYRKYIAERFPLKIYGVYTLSLFTVSYFFGTSLIENFEINFIEIFLGFCTVFLFFLQLRIFDEYKDYEEDLILHPERMLSKGEITLDELKILLYITIIIEIVINISLGIPKVIMWIILCIYSLLMLKEFFCSSFLKRYPMLYILSHQIVIPLICLYSMSVHMNFSIFNRNHANLIILFLSACICLTINIELVRKLKIGMVSNNNSDKNSIENRSNKIIGLLPCNGLIICSWLIFMVICFFLNVHILFAISSTILSVFYIIEGYVVGLKPDPLHLKRYKQHNYFVVFGVFIISACAFYIG